MAPCSSFGVVGGARGARGVPRGNRQGATLVPMVPSLAAGDAPLREVWGARVGTRPVGDPSDSTSPSLPNGRPRAERRGEGSCPDRKLRSRKLPRGWPRGRANDGVVNAVRRTPSPAPAPAEHQRHLREQRAPCSRAGPVVPTKRRKPA